MQGGGGGAGEGGGVAPSEGAKENWRWMINREQSFFSRLPLLLLFSSSSRTEIQFPNAGSSVASFPTQMRDGAGSETEALPQEREGLKCAMKYLLGHFSVRSSMCCTISPNTGCLVENGGPGAVQDDWEPMLRGSGGWSGWRNAHCLIKGYQSGGG